MTTAPKCRPIPFTSEMVQAILRGDKTQTRRPVNPQPPARFLEENCDIAAITNGKRWSLSRIGPPTYKAEAWHPDPHPGIKPPLGIAGDRLWVREPTELLDRRFNEGKEPLFAQVRYVADGHEDVVPWPDRIKRVDLGKRLPNGCFREASRITLEITRVRMERLQKITARDVASEGVTIPKMRIDDPRIEEADKQAGGFDGGFCQLATNCFRDLWDSINAKRGIGWDVNPWVWVYEFKVSEVRA